MKQLFAGRDPPSIRQEPFEFPEVAARLPERNKDAGRPVRQWVNSYDASLRYADWAVGEVEALLRRAGVFDDTLFIVTSDHGEAFGEHGYVFHSCGLYDELVHVPLLMKFPRGERPRARVAALTQTVDLLPTVFDLLRVPAPAEQVQGRSLVPLLTGDAEKVHDYVFARDGGEAPSYLVRSLNSALILYQGGKLRALYDLDAAPLQTRNVIDEQPERAEEMLSAFRQFGKTQRREPVDFIDPGARPTLLPGGPTIEMPESLRDELRSLGYLD
jgi:arylsulfatase A-like enzyme